jgi:DNA (cytosine-5)-methyltransferase 1
VAVEPNTVKMSAKYKILNLHACLGGNRYKWDEVADIEVTAVERDPELAKLYQERFPSDKVVVADAYQYLLDHFREFDFIWASPPCPSHSRSRFWNSYNEYPACKPVFPDLRLYEMILFLEHYYTGKYCVENVIPYYTPLIPAKKRGRHLYWTNFNLPKVLSDRKISMNLRSDEVAQLSKFHDYDFTKYKGEQRRDKIARNLVDYEAGRTILETALGIIRSNNVAQTSLFTQTVAE